MTEKCFYCGAEPHVFPHAVFCPTEGCEALEREDLLLWDNTQRNLKIYHDTRKFLLQCLNDMERETKERNNVAL